MKSVKTSAVCTILFALSFFAANVPAAPTPSPALLVVIKDEHKLAIVDPATNQIVTTVPGGRYPHAVVASDDGKTAYVSDFAPFVIEEGPGRYITMIDLPSQKQVKQIDVGYQSMPHGMAI